MSKLCPCDIDGICPYNSESGGSCEYWCGINDDSNNDEVEFWQTIALEMED